MKERPPGADHPYRRAAFARPRRGHSLPRFRSERVGTLNLLEAARQFCPETPFIHMSTNKVYGDLPNSIPLKELETRWDYADPAYAERHSGNIFHRPIEAFPLRRFESGRRRHGAGIRPLFQHAHLLPARRLPDRPEPFRRGTARISELSGAMQLEEREYKVFGYKGKQVRDNIHSEDVANFMHEFYQSPRIAEVYNLGGGKGEFLLHSGSVPHGGKPHRQAAALVLRRSEPGRRPHLLLQRSAQNEGALSGVGHHPAAAETSSRKSSASWSTAPRPAVHSLDAYSHRWNLRIRGSGRWRERSRRAIEGSRIFGVDNLLRPGSESNRARSARHGRPGISWRCAHALRS